MSNGNGNIINIQNPIPILQQPRSSLITTNPFIPNEVRELELQALDKEANDIIERQYRESQASGIGGMTLKQIGQNISISTIDVFDEMFIKPENKGWDEYIPEILQKDGRYGYIGILLFIIGLLLILFERS